MPKYPRTLRERRQREREMVTGASPPTDAPEVIASGDLVTGINPNAPTTRTPEIDDL